MLFIELRVPQGVFGERERRDLARRLTGRRLLAAAEDGDASAANPGVIDLLDSLTHVVVREEEIWVAGGELLDPSGGARYMVNVIVGMWGKELADHLISRIAAELAEAEGNPEPRAVINVISLLEGGYGLHGAACRSADMLQLIEDAKAAAPSQAPDGTVVDPVCGATVRLEEAVMLERDGQTYGFCCPHCRGHFARRLQDTAAP